MRPPPAACARLLVCAAALLQTVTASPEPNWPDTPLARLAATALLQTFNAELLSHDSATATLERWCDAHHLASPARVVAERDAGAEQPPSPEQRQALGVTAAEPVRYRRVRLRCGSVVLSEAENWYVPGRLTPEMNAELEGTDHPFGRVVQSLHFQRHTIAVSLLWQPLPAGWELRPMSQGAASARLPALKMAIPGAVLAHRAVLSLADGTPISEVVETYTNHIFAFPAPVR